MRLAWLCASLALAACGDAVHDGPAARAAGEYALIDHSAWRVVPWSDDPFADEASAPEACGETTFGVEPFGSETVFSVDGLDCAWMTVQQPLLHGLRAGDLVRVRVWNFELTGRRGNTATLAMWVDNAPFWSKELPIPGPSALTIEFVEVTSDIAAGSPLTWHVHNHGSNSYSLFEVTLIVPVDAALN